MRQTVRSLEQRVLAHCAHIGVNPPLAAVRRFALLRWIESRWYLADKLDTDRRDLLEDLAFRLRLHEPAPGTPLCTPDLPGCILEIAHAPAYAVWPDAPLCVSMRDLV